MAHVMWLIMSAEEITDKTNAVMTRMMCFMTSAEEISDKTNKQAKHYYLGAECVGHLQPYNCLTTITLQRKAGVLLFSAA